MAAGNVPHLALVLVGSVRSVIRGQITSEREKGGLLFAVCFGVAMLGLGLSRFYGLGGYWYAKHVE